MPRRKPTSTNYGTGSLRSWQRKDEQRERRALKKADKRNAIREERNH